MRGALRRVLPVEVRARRYQLKRLGLRRYRGYRRLERVERRKPPPRAGAPFDIGGAAIVLHESTLAGVRSHWVESGHGILELAAFRRLAPSHRQLVDVGAAEGIYSAAFCALTGRDAWAFEPSPEMFERLCHLCRLNTELRIHATNVALGACAGRRMARRYTDGQFSGVGAPVADAASMTVTTLDGFVASRGLDPDFAKVDVEGMEFDVLRGGERTFRELVRTIVLEAHYGVFAEIGESLAGLQRLLADYGFGVESLDGSPIDDLEAFARARPERVPGYTIVVCRK